MMTYRAANQTASLTDCPLVVEHCELQQPQFASSREALLFSVLSVVFSQKRPEMLQHVLKNAQLSEQLLI